MSIFNIFKKKEDTPQATSAAENVTEPQAYLGDLQKTQVIYELVQVAPEARDKKWSETFLSNIAEASFRCGEPQVITGPDGFPYFQLFLPEPNQQFQCFVIDNMKDDFLLSSGFGVVINPTSSNADWVLTYGDILNYQLNNEFYTDSENLFSKNNSDETITENEQIMVAQPAETILPMYTRKLIAEFLKLNGVIEPKVLLMVRNRKDGEGVTQDLVFNLTPQDFNDEETYRGVMQTIGWFLPRHYSYVGMSEAGFADGFMPL